MTTILVTGATGFAGSHALEYLSGRADIHLIAACRNPDRLPTGFEGDIRKGDLRDPRYLTAVCEDVDTVIHAAAWSSLWANKRASASLYLEPSLALIHAAQRAGVTRIVNVSTTSAAAPDHAADACSAGIPRRFWPHLCNVIRIEEALRTLAHDELTTVNLRFGLFAGHRYGLGLLPILLPRLKTHLVPWVASGSTGMPIIDGRDIGQALGRAALASRLSGYESFNVVGPEVPTVRQVIRHLHETYGYAEPHFSVPFALAYPFAWLMETIDPVVPWEPLVTRSIIHLLEDTGANNTLATQKLGYQPQHHWHDSIKAQLSEMSVRQRHPMPMACPIN